MLSESNIIPTVAVKDLSKAKKFYEDTLGLEEYSSDDLPEDTGGIKYKSGNSYLFVYEAEANAGTNQATCASWHVDDLEAAVSSLEDKGLEFEHYDLPGVTRDGAIHSLGDVLKAAWFKDPDGNIFSIDSGPAV